MFSGIVESKAKLLQYTPHDPSHLTAQIKIEKPSDFNDLKNGDSIAVNGICLTVATFDDNVIVFDLGTETLKLCVGVFSSQPRIYNLERSLKLGDRIHGHMVTGHVDAMAVVSKIAASGASQLLTLQLQNSVHSAMVWRKGSLCVNGVSLTINDVHNEASVCTVEFCLIPETLTRTNLGDLKIGDKVTIEFDQMARALSRKNELMTESANENLAENLTDTKNNWDKKNELHT